MKEIKYQVKQGKIQKKIKVLNFGALKPGVGGGAWIRYCGNFTFGWRNQ